MGYCPKCGYLVTDDSKFCINCGAPLDSQNSSLNTNIDAHQMYLNEKKTKSQTSGLVGFILGLCSLAAWFIPLIGYPVCICGIVFSGKGFYSEKKYQPIAGLVLSVLGLIATLINSILGVIMAS